MSVRQILDLPWHAVARRLREEGMSYESICREVGREIGVVRRLLSPGAREEQNARRARCYRARWARDPEFRERQNKKRRARYAANPKARARVLERNSQRKKLKRAEINAKRRERWANDPEFREREMARQRARRAAALPSSSSPAQKD